MRALKLTKLKLTAENGVKMPALKIFSEAIKYLKHHFENLLENSMLSHDGSRPAVKVTEDRESSWSSDILWVLTVPAIWSDQAKQFMREAAIQVSNWTFFSLDYRWNFFPSFHLLYPTLYFS